MRLFLSRAVSRREQQQPLLDDDDDDDDDDAEQKKKKTSSRCGEGAAADISWPRTQAAKAARRRRTSEGRVFMA